MHPRAFAALFLFSLLAGCGSAVGPPDSDSSALPPGPGAFREGDAAVDALAARLDAAFVTALEACAAPPAALEALRASLEARNLLGAVWDLGDSCPSLTPDAVLAEARSAIGNGTEDAVFTGRQAQAQAAWSRLAGEVDRSFAPGTVLDAEVWATLMRRIAWLPLTFDTAAQAYAAYRDDGNEYNLATALYNLELPAASENATSAFLRSFAWSPGSCDPGDVPALGEAQERRVDHLLELARQLEPPSEGAPVSELYGSLEKGALPNVRLYREHGWWPALLAMEKTLSLDEGILDAHGADRLPTQEEAVAIVARELAHNRTLDGEEMLRTVEGQLGETSVPWDSDLERARKAWALPRMDSGFTSLACDG